MSATSPTNQNNQSFPCYKAHEILGRGGSAVVHAATQVPTGNIYAVKCFDKSAGNVSTVRRELSLLADLRNHPHIITLHDYFHDKTCNYLVLDYMDCGDLTGYIVANHRLPETESKGFARGLLKAVEHCHALDIVHRDVKPDNVLIDQNGGVKLTDFGLSRKIPTNRRSGIVRRRPMTTYCGTKDYTSPEMLGGQPYSQEVDIWGVGIVIFIMLGGYHPFHDPSKDVKEQQILNGKISFYPPYFAEVSDKAVNVIQRMMVTNPSHRISARESLKLTWFAEETAETATEKTTLLEGFPWNLF